MYIDRARLIRYRYHELTGQPHDERRQTFPVMSIDEARQFAADQEADAGA